MKLPTRVLPLLLFVPLLPAQVSPEVADLIKKEGLGNSKVMDYLDYLTNTIGHRLTGSDNFTLACNWAKGEFEKMGLKVHLSKWGEWNVVWNRGQWHGRVVEPVEMDLQVATEAWTAGTQGRVRAELIRASNAEVRDRDERLRGKWILTRRIPRSREIMARYLSAKVAGVLYPSTGDAKYPNRIRVFGNPRPFAAQRKLVQVCVRRDQFEKLWEMVRVAERSGESVQDASEREGAPAKPAKSQPVLVELDIRNRFRDEKVVLHNVVADLVGTEHPEERVVVCGHLDSWHQATGTTDNGTGSSTTLEAARILSTLGVKPRRTIRFILWGGEEQGLLGSLHHVRRYRQEMDKVSCVFNHDTGTNWAHGLSVTDAMYDDMVKVMAPVMTMKAPDPNHKGPVFALRKVARFGSGGGSDHASYAAAGVPPFDWHLAGRADYFRFSWHSQWDTFDAAIPEYQRHTATVIALAALGVADLPHLLPRAERPKPRSDAKPVAEGQLGVDLDGLKVTGVDSSGIAHAGGMKSGDTIQAINGTAVKSVVDLVAAMRDAKAPWNITVLRDGKQVGLLLEPKKVP